MTYNVQFPGLGLEFALDRVAFSIGGFDIYWYGIIIAAGMLLAMAFAFRKAVDFGIDADRAANYCGDRQGTRLTYDAVGSAVSAVRACAPLKSGWKKQVEEDHKNRT